MGTKGCDALVYSRRFDRDARCDQYFISEIAGPDIHPHSGRTALLIEAIAARLRREANDRKVPGGRAIPSEFGKCHRDLVAIAKMKRLERSELTFSNVSQIATEWILADSAEA